MRTACLLLMLFSLPAFALDAETPERFKLLLLDLSTTGIDADTASLVGDLMAVRLSQYDNLEIFAGSDVRRMMELEADKTAVGCDDESCIAEVAGALGARYVVYGRLGKLGTRFIMTLNLFDADLGKAINRKELQASSLDELSDNLAKRLDVLVRPLMKGEKVAAAVTRSKKPTPAPVVSPSQQSASDNEIVASAALSIALLASGIAVFSLSYISAVSFAAFLDDDTADLNYLPVFGPLVYGFTSQGEAIGPVCFSCAGVQSLGLLLTAGGALFLPGIMGDKAPTRLSARGPPPIQLAIAAPVSAPMAY